MCTYAHVCDYMHGYINIGAHIPIDIAISAWFAFLDQKQHSFKPHYSKQQHSQLPTYKYVLYDQAICLIIGMCLTFRTTPLNTHSACRTRQLRAPNGWSMQTKSTQPILFYELIHMPYIACMCVSMCVAVFIFVFHLLCYRLIHEYCHLSILNCL